MWYIINGDGERCRVVDSCGCYKNEKPELIKILYDEIDKVKIIWG